MRFSNACKYSNISCAFCNAIALNRAQIWGFVKVSDYFVMVKSTSLVSWMLNRASSVSAQLAARYSPTPKMP